MKLNVGEMVILTADRSKPNSLGSHFFSKGEGDNRIQRLLIIRLVDIKKSPVIRSSFNPSR